MTRTRITKALARTKYGIVTSHNDYRYYLLPNGDVVDSDGDTRYSLPARIIRLCSCGAQAILGDFCPKCASDIPF